MNRFSMKRSPIPWYMLFLTIPYYVLPSEGEFSLHFLHYFFIFSQLPSRPIYYFSIAPVFKKLQMKRTLQKVVLEENMNIQENSIPDPIFTGVERIARTELLQPRGSTLYWGDALTVLRRLPSESVRCIATSPPYWGLRDYGITEQIGLEKTLPQFINHLVTIFSEAKRVLTGDGTLWLNIGDGYTSGNRGWRAPDRKNPARAMEIRPDTPEGLKPKDLIGAPWRLAFALQEDGWYLRSDIVWHKPNAMPESVKDRPSRSHEYLFMLTKSERYFYNHEAVKEPADGGGKRNRRSVWHINTKPFAGAHFATFPPELILPCILASSEPDDFVLDPFFGSGTVGLVCQEQNRRYIGIELNQEYVTLAFERLRGRGSSIIKIEAA